MPDQALLRIPGTDTINDHVGTFILLITSDDLVFSVLAVGSIKSKELEEQYQANIAESLKHIDELQAKNGLTDEQVDAAMALVLQIANDAVVGKFTPETIEMAMKAINHDADVTEASYEGEVRGRNTKIDETLRKRQSGDGVANLGGKNNIPTQKQNRIGVFALADEAR